MNADQPRIGGRQRPQHSVCHDAGSVLTHLNLSFVCAAASLAEVMRLGTKMRRPPCSSPPLAVTIVGLCAVVMAAHCLRCQRDQVCLRRSQVRAARPAVSCAVAPLLRRGPHSGGPTPSLQAPKESLEQHGHPGVRAGLASHCGCAGHQAGSQQAVRKPQKLPWPKKKKAMAATPAEV